uniref:Uncharacterized protein n=1 Tax=Oreochromis aureus TaxID=47969 RepID=A0AAZ1X2A2_OREAU
MANWISLDNVRNPGLTLDHRQSAGGELLLCFCSFYNRHIVVAIILCDEAHRFPVVPMVVRVVGDKLLCVCLVQSVNLNGTLQGVAQQEHLHLPKRENAKGGGVIARLQRNSNRLLKQLHV